MSITVIDVFRELKIEPEPEVTWAVGAAVREVYAQDHDGVLPPKALRPKTNGGGSHCFAVYPERMHATIARIIRAHAAVRARQGSLF